MAAIPYDPLLLEIADYVDRCVIDSDLAYRTAHYCLLDSIGCALEALDHPACTRLLGPVVEGITVQHGARVPGTALYLDPVTAAFNVGAMLRWTDYSDTPDFVSRYTATRAGSRRRWRRCSRA